MGDYVCGECAYYRGDRMDGACYLSGAITYYDCGACTAFTKEESNG